MNLLIPPFLGSQLYKEVSDHSCRALDRQILQQYPWIQSLDSLLPLQRVDWQLRGGSRAVPSPRHSFVPPFAWVVLQNVSNGICGVQYEISQGQEMKNQPKSSEGYFFFFFFFLRVSCRLVGKALLVSRRLIHGFRFTAPTSPPFGLPGSVLLQLLSGRV